MELVADPQVATSWRVRQDKGATKKVFKSSERREGASPLFSFTKKCGMLGIFEAGIADDCAVRDHDPSAVFPIIGPYKHKYKHKKNYGSETQKNSSC